MHTEKTELLIIDEIRQVLALTDRSQTGALEEAILQAQRVFVGGAGRSLLIMRTFAMRLMHIGISSHVVGETITPAIEPGDLLIVASGSGSTRTTLAILEAAQARGALTAAITAHVSAPIPQSADLVLELHSPISRSARTVQSQQPPGSLFEQCLLVSCEAMVMTLMDRLGTTEAEMRERHTKLE